MAGVGSIISPTSCPAPCLSFPFSYWWPQYSCYKMLWHRLGIIVSADEGTKKLLREVREYVPRPPILGRSSQLEQFRETEFPSCAFVRFSFSHPPHSEIPSSFMSSLGLPPPLLSVTFPGCSWSHFHDSPKSMYFETVVFISFQVWRYLLILKQKLHIMVALRIGIDKMPTHRWILRCLIITLWPLGWHSLL